MCSPSPGTGLFIMLECRQSRQLSLQSAISARCEMSTSLLRVARLRSSSILCINQLWFLHCSLSSSCHGGSCCVTVMPVSCHANTAILNNCFFQYSRWQLARFGCHRFLYLLTKFSCFHLLFCLCYHWRPRPLRSSLYNCFALQKSGDGMSLLWRPF